jgi:cell shape-determining protein MreC
MNYQPRNKRESNRYSVAIKVAGAAVVLLILFAFVAPQALSGFFSRLFSPLWNITAGSYSQQNMALQQQVEAQSADAAAIALLEQENSELKTVLGRAPTKDSVLAVVLKKPPFSAYDNLIIDIGADHNVAVGDMVYAVSSASVATSSNASSTAASSTIVSTPATSVTGAASTATTSATVLTSVKVPIGLVTEVDSVTSKVDLFSSPGEQYNVEIGSDHIAVTAAGRGAGTFGAVLPREANVAVGDIVIIPSIESLAFATVTDIITDPTRPYATILFQSPVNAFALHWVEVDVKK